jgi:hypothetical protein
LAKSVHDFDFKVFASSDEKALTKLDHIVMWICALANRIKTKPGSSFEAMQGKSFYKKSPGSPTRWGK